MRNVWVIVTTALLIACFGCDRIEQHADTAESKGTSETAHRTSPEPSESDIPDALVRSWAHEIDQDFWKEFRLDGKQIAEMILTFDAQGNYSETIKFTGDDGKSDNAGTFKCIPGDDAIVKIEIISLGEDGHRPIFQGGDLSLAADDTLKAAMAGVPVRFKFTPYEPDLILSYTVPALDESAHESELPTPGLWRGTTSNGQLWLRVTFRVDDSKQTLTGIQYEVGNEGKEKARATWRPEGAATRIGEQGVFRYVDQHDNSIEGTFLSAAYAEGTVSKPFMKLECPDGQFRYPPLKWRTAPHQ